MISKWTKRTRCVRAQEGQSESSKIKFGLGLIKALEILGCNIAVLGLDLDIVQYNKTHADHPRIDV